LTSFYMTILKLARNEPVESEAELESLLNHQAGRPFNLQDSSVLDSLSYLDLYRGNLTRAWARLNTFWPEYSRSLLFRTQLVRIQMLELRARTVVAMAERSDQPASLLRQAGRDADHLERERQPWAVAHAHYVRAAIAAGEENAGRAIEELTLAASGYDAAEMPLNAQIMRYRLGEVLTGTEARVLREAADCWIREQWIAAPVRWAGLYAPGFARISNESMETTY
jgi:hypothetical protein